MASHEWCPARLRAGPATIEPEPEEAEREAILAAVAPAFGCEDGWAATALLEGVEGLEPDP